MSDVMEARQYGVKTFPSIIVFVKRIPELYEGDVTDEAAVLGWALVQAGIKEVADDEDDDESMVEEVMEDIDEMLTFPGASAEAERPPTPKVEPKKSSPPSPSVPPPSSNKSEETEDLNEIVDSIKNDNNVVVFFCKYY